MQIQMVRAKLHQARVTGADLNYEGSIGIDIELLQAARIYPYERVLVVNLENGARLETYTIPMAAGSRSITLNGAAARLVHVQDRVIIMSFATVDAPPPDGWQPRVVQLTETNEVDWIAGDNITTEEYPLAEVSPS